MGVFQLLNYSIISCGRLFPFSIIIVNVTIEHYVVAMNHSLRGERVKTSERASEHMSHRTDIKTMDELT